MPTRRIKCFVAMAFGQKDGDTLYKKHILPTLTSLHIESLRVDQRQHKDDLNNFIIRMLKESDIALADLTYSRPSVYYEAGFAERQIPVVYTVREDHLSRSQSDDRLRVHFDLEMKKIVAWRDPDDPSFSKRLKKRIEYLIRPIMQEKEEDESLRIDKETFGSLSVSSRLEEIQSRFRVRLSNKRFWIRRLWDVRQMSASLIEPAIGLIGIKKVGKTCQLCVIVAAEAITKKQIKITINHFTGHSLLGSDQDVTDFEDQYFFCSLKRLPESRLTAYFPQSKLSNFPSTFTFAQELGFNGGNKRRVSIHLISPIDSKARLKKEVNSRLARITNKKSNRYTYLLSHHFGREIQFQRRPSIYSNLRLVYRKKRQPIPR